MSDYLLLSLRFRARHREPMLHEVAWVMEDIEAAYFAAHRFRLDQAFLDRPSIDFATVFHTERRALSSAAGGFSGDVLAEVEYTTRAIERLRRSGADAYVIEQLMNGVALLLEQEVEQIRLGRDLGRQAGGVPPLEMRRISMASPFDILTAIPPEYWKGGGLVLFLTALERRFNMVGRIRTERARLRAEEREAELREKTAARAIAELEDRDEPPERLGELAAEDAPFQLESGELRVEADADAQPGRPD